MRMGDGRRVYMTREQIVDEINAGIADAVECAGVPELDANDIDHLVEIMVDKNRVVSVESGKEIVLTQDGGPHKYIADSQSSSPCLDMGRVQGCKLHERAVGMDCFESGWWDGSIKNVKGVITMEQNHVQELVMNTTIPMLYGFMPNLGLYYSPTGQYGNPADLMREFRIEEAMQQGELAAEDLTNDIVYIADHVLDVGIDGLDFDTTASAGDIEFVSVLKSIEKIREFSPGAYIQMGMSAENVLGIHGMMDYKGTIAAGLYPHDQVKLAETAGVSTYGPVVNTNTGKSTAWNVARAVTMVKECARVSTIPLQVNMGMGVGGVPMFETPPVDAISRADKAMVEIANVDGI